MDAGAYAMQSDPLRNPQFRRGWTDPPNARRRSPPGTPPELKPNHRTQENTTAVAPMQDRTAAA